MYLLTPDPHDQTVDKNNIYFVGKDDPQSIENGVRELAPKCNNGVVWVWKSVEKHKTTSQVTIIAKYQMNEKGEVLPA